MILEDKLSRLYAPSLFGEGESSLHLNPPSTTINTIFVDDSDPSSPSSDIALFIRQRLGKTDPILSFVILVYRKYYKVIMDPSLSRLKSISYKLLRPKENFNKIIIMG